MKQLIKYLVEVGIWVIVIFMVGMFGLSLWTNNNVLKTKPWIVQSGSMEPTIMTGDVIITSPQRKYFVNQIVTFKNRDGRVVTHRIVKNVGSDSSPVFVTKGDANRTIDGDEIKNEQILGKAVFTLPKLGYAVAYSRTPGGLIFMVVVPVTIIVYDEVRKIVREKKAMA